MTNKRDCLYAVFELPAFVFLNNGGFVLSNNYGVKKNAKPKTNYAPRTCAAINSFKKRKRLKPSRRGLANTVIDEHNKYYGVRRCFGLSSLPSPY